MREVYCEAQTDAGEKVTVFAEYPEILARDLSGSSARKRGIPKLVLADGSTVIARKDGKLIELQTDRVLHPIG